MKAINRILTALAFAAAILPASAAEMYYNRLSKGAEIIPAGTYGDIVVPEGGYKATQFPSALANITEAVNDFGGSYANIIRASGSYASVFGHTISGWFKIPVSANDMTIFIVKSDEDNISHRGYKVMVPSDGTVKVGKVNGADNWQNWKDHATWIWSQALGETGGKVPINQWFYLTLAVTKESASRAITVKMYVNGVEINMPTDTVQTDLRGTKSCQFIKVGDGVVCAGLRVDDTAVTDPATMKAWAVDSKYVVSPSVEAVATAHWTGAAQDDDLGNCENWACTNFLGNVVEEGVPGESTTVYFTGTNISVQIEGEVDWAAVSVSGKLGAKCNWSGLKATTIVAGSVLDLNGQEFSSAGFTSGGIFTVTNSAEGVATFAVDVGAGKSSSLGGSVICGNIALDVLSGTFQLTTSTGITGGNPNLITVYGGATLDENGVIDTPLALRLEDGATLTNTGTGRGYTKAQFTGGLELAEGATAYIDTANEMALTATGYATMPISIGNGTLVKKGTGKISIQNGSIVGTGKIRVEAGEINLGNKGLAIDDAITVEVLDNAETSTYIWIQADCSIPRITGNGRIAANSGNLTVTKYYSGLLQVGLQGGDYPFTKGALTFGDGATLDLTQVEGTWTEHEKVVFGENAMVTVDLTGRTVEEGDKVIAWTAQPPTTAKILARGADVYFVRKDDGLYAAKSIMIFVR